MRYSSYKLLSDLQRKSQVHTLNSKYNICTKPFQIKIKINTGPTRVSRETTEVGFLTRVRSNPTEERLRISPKDPHLKTPLSSQISIEKTKNNSFPFS